MEQIDITNKSKRWNQEEENLLKKLYNRCDNYIKTIKENTKWYECAMRAGRACLESNA